MNYKIGITIMTLIALMNTPNAHAGIFSNFARALGLKEDGVLGKVAKVADEVGNAVVANKVNDTLNNYGSEQIKSYNDWVNQYNENQDRKVQKYLSEVDRFKMDYCKSHGFYDLWYSQYGDDWFECAGRSWFDSQDDLAERRTGERLLPWHLRDGDGVTERVNSSKIDGSLTNVVLGAIGLSDADARRAEDWKKSDKYGKQDILIDQTFDIIGSATDNEAFVNAFRRIVKANNQYLKSKSNPETSNLAINNMVLDLSNIIYDTYEQGVENRKAYLAEKLQVRSKMEEMGFDPSYTREVAGTILSIQNSRDLSDHEKKEWLRLLGFYGEEDAVIEIAQSVSQMSEEQAQTGMDEASEKKAKEAAEQERREREEQIRKERERKEAISFINAVVVDSYIIDESDLNDQQKDRLIKIVDVLNNHEDLTIEIIGYTCDLGTETINEKIGMRRAEKVKEYLIDLGVADNRIFVSTVGETKPAFENTNAQNRLKNRRVTFLAK